MTLDALKTWGLEIGRKAPFWTQGPGSNISWKEASGPMRDPLLWIKASGRRLDEMDQRGALGRVPLRQASEFFSAGVKFAAQAEERYAEFLASCASPEHGFGRPSMETSLHVVLPQPFVAHFHSLAAILMAEHDEATVREITTNAGLSPAVIVPPVLPGWKLGVAIQPLAHETNVLLLRTHGVVVAVTNTSDFARWDACEDEFLRRFALHELITVKKADDGYRRAREVVANGWYPMKHYMPDVAVFRERLLRVLERSSGDGTVRYRLRPTAEVIDRDMVELWLAIVLLYRANLDLSELPEDVVTTVADLPVERARRDIVRD